jgi:ribulose-5-phosphate 4-epimerase/fuculose-1-phosphate aldolase
MKEHELRKLLSTLMKLMNKGRLEVDELVELVGSQGDVIDSLSQQMDEAQKKLIEMEVNQTESKEGFKRVLGNLNDLNKATEKLENRVNQFGLATEDVFTPYRIEEIALKRKRNRFDYLRGKYPFGVEYKGVFPELKGEENVEAIIKSQFQIRDFARRVVDETNSSAHHLILSKFLVDEDIMLITATQTNKLKLRMLSEIPCAKCDLGTKKVIYYGDEKKWPSSESMTMWAMFKILIAAGKNYRTIIHAHTPHLMADYAWNHRGLKAKDLNLPLVKWRHFGEPELGEDIAHSMLNASTQGVILNDHGPFVVGMDFADSCDFLRKAEEEASGKT